ncbi:MAG: hypothetical protein J5907_06885 [Bacteroidales bacterium]|nr:hypothetical protein [Bacteroidales bacterium]
MEDKTMKKVFGIAALLLTLAACNKVETDITPVEQLSDSKIEGITITATLAPKTADTKAVADGGDKITVTWAQNEKIAILYEVSGTKYVAEANIDSVDGTTGAATISFTVESGTADNTACTLVYPAKLSDGTTTVYNDGLSGVKDAATLLSAQDGTLNTNLDVRVGTGTIQTTTPSLDVTIQPVAQYSIFKFTTQNISGTGITPSEFKVSDSEDNVIATVSPSASAFYVALPALAVGTYWFSATADSKPYIASARVTSATSAGTYYQSTVKMATLGDVMANNGKFYANAAAATTAGTKAIAMIAYVGSETGISSLKHGLAIGLKDEDNAMAHDWAESACSDKNNPENEYYVAGAYWYLPSKNQWGAMFNSYGGSYGNLNTAITAAGGDSLSEGLPYWTSTEEYVNTAYSITLDPGTGDYYYVIKAPLTETNLVRAVLVF